MGHCTVTREGAAVRLRLQGEAHLPQAAEFHAALQQAMDLSRHVLIEVIPEQRVGLSILQLIWSAQCTAQETGHRIEIQPATARLLEWAMEREGLPLPDSLGIWEACGEGEGVP